MSTYSSPDASINQSFNDLSMNINAIFSIITNFCNTFNISYLKQQYTQNMQSFQHNANQQLFYTVLNQISTFYDSFFSIQNQNQNIIQNCFNSISQKISEQQNLINENESLKSQIECLRLSQSQQNSAQNAKSDNKLTKIIESLKTEIHTLKVDIDVLKRENKHLKDKNFALTENSGAYYAKGKKDLKAESDRFRKISDGLFLENLKLVRENSDLKIQVQKLAAENMQLKSQIISNNSANFNSSLHLSQQSSNSSTEFQELTNKNKQLSDEREALKQQVVVLQQNNYKCEDQIKNLKQQLRQLNYEKDSLDSQMKNLTDENHRLASQVTNLGSQLNKQAEESKGKSSWFSSRSSELEKKIESLNSQIADKDKRIDHYKQSSEALTKKSQEDQETISQLNGNVQSLEKQVQDKDEQIKTLNDDKNQLQKEYNDLSENHNQMKATIPIYRGIFQKINSNCEEETPKKLESFQNSALDKISELSQKIDDIKSKLAEVPKNDKSNCEEELRANIQCLKQRTKEIEILDSRTIHDLENLGRIGLGNGAEVVKVARKTMYALKIMDITTGNTHESFEHFINEYEIMNMMDHPNILKTHGIFLSDETNPPSILLDLCPMNLHKVITEKLFNNAKIVFMIYQIAEGMRYVHFQKVIHRDLKPTNILIESDGTIKICDFGISKLMTAGEQVTKGIGTQKFMSPEVMNEEDYNEKADVYSFGVIVFFILSGGEMPRISIRDICNGQKAEIPTTFTSFSNDLIDSCWNFKPDERPSFNDICEDIEHHEFNLLELTEQERNEVETLIKQHKEKIPPYSS
ncbi:hypothetical protein M9Y10_006311 [Tritrichomonas musculus]|uniref:Protein kinase domain-containing protein n=1 Tax=Tritrichomonas musculus TaxID=1915356 RepID=A0ABR2JF04_9EUKA